jgi:hypothetical protein
LGFLRRVRRLNNSGERVERQFLLGLALRERVFEEGYGYAGRVTLREVRSEVGLRLIKGDIRRLKAVFDRSVVVFDSSGSKSSVECCFSGADSICIAGRFLTFDAVADKVLGASA